MGLNCGIVGLPNAGKSTLFNALMRKQVAEAADYPFCTIEPNIGRIATRDERLRKLANIAYSEKIVPNQLEIVDIAGLVKGASKGEGLGNQFLAHIREVDAIIHMVNCFSDRKDINPVQDIQLVTTELLLADLQLLEKKKAKLSKKIHANTGNICEELQLITQIDTFLQQGITMKNALHLLDDKAKDTYQALNYNHQLLTAKPVLYVSNIAERDIDTENHGCKKIREFIHRDKLVILCAQSEAEIVLLNEGEEKEFRKELNITKSGLDLIAQECFDLLNLITFFTVGPKEARAWTIHRGDTALQAAASIHTDFARGFIKAETISYTDYLQYNGENNCKNTGKTRLEGKDYIVQDGDIIHFKFNV